MKQVLALAGVGLAGLAAANTWLGWRAETPGNGLPGEPRYYHWRRGVEVFNVFYATDTRGAGVPVVLIHGIDAAASSAEWRAVFAGLAGKHPVYALDLLGFGLSDRPARRYAAAEYVALLDDFLGDVVERPALVVASSLSAAYAVGAAARSPERVAALLLVCPTGLQRFNRPPARAQRLLGDFLRLPIVGSAAFNLLVSRASIAYFLEERTFANPKLVTAEMVDRAYRTSHQPGARHAAADFLGGSLFCDLRGILAKVRQPLWIAWGRHARAMPVSDANLFLRERPGARLNVFDRAGSLPHAETPAEFVAYVEQMLDGLEEKGG